LPAGIVVTGGAAETVGLASVGKEVLRMPTRVASPAGVTGLIEEISTPAYSGSVGLLLYGDKITFTSAGVAVPLIRGGNILGSAKRILNWLRSFLP
jgi:cell division ATPase FtsA